MASIPTAAADFSHPKRPAPLPAPGEDDNAAATKLRLEPADPSVVSNVLPLSATKRRRTVASVEPSMRAQPEDRRAGSRGRPRQGERGGAGARIAERVAELEADNASLTAEVTRAPQAPAAAATARSAPAPDPAAR